MHLVNQALPLQALGKDFRASSERLKANIEKLDREESLFLACKLNLLTSNWNAEPNNHQMLQERAWQLLINDERIDPYSVSRIERFMKAQNKSFTYFFRPHFLELIPWLAVWGADLPDRFVHAKTREAGAAFIKAVLIAHELAAQRLEPRVARSILVEPDRVNFEALPLLRQLSLTSPGVTNPFALLGRSTLLMEKNFFARNPHYSKRFTEITGLTLENYRDCATLILLSVTLETENAQSLQSMYEFHIEDLSHGDQQRSDLLARFLKHESTTVDSLAKAYLGKSPNGFTELRPLRERPILTTMSGRSVVMDLHFLAERATYGPLFYDIDQADEKFNQFGIAFENYVQKESEKRAQALGCNPPFNNVSDGKVGTEVTDLLCVMPKANLFVETKGVWLRDDLIKAPSADEFWREVKSKYGLSRKVAARPKGAGQLSSKIQGVLERNLTLPSECQFDMLLPIFPILLVHDVHMALPLFGHFLAQEFAQDFLLPSIPSSGCFSWKGAVIHNIIVSSVDEFENIQHFGKRYGIVEFLTDYSKADGQRKLGLRHFLTTAQNHRELPDYSDAMKEGRRILSDISVRWFGAELPIELE